MAQQQVLGKERVGRITIERYQKKYIRLRWTLKGKTYSMNIGTESRDAIKAARAKAQLIDSDITFDRFDPTLEKYGKKRSTVLEVVPPPVARLDLSELWNKFLEDKLPNIKAKTADEYESFTKLLNKLGQLASYNALETKQALLVNTTSDQARRMLLYLSACCDWGIRHKLIEHNPYKGLAADIPRKSAKHQPDAFTEAEMEAVISAFRNGRPKGRNYDHYAPLVEFWFRTGCRPSEAIGLTWGKVAADCSNVTFSGSYQVIKGRHHWVDGSKNNKSRTITVSTRVQQLLWEVRPDSPGEERLVFPSPEGKPINYDNFTRRAWNAVVDEIKPNTTPYNCRDTFITNQLMHGVPGAVIAKWCDTSTRMIDSNYADRLKLNQLKPLD